MHCHTAWRDRTRRTQIWRWP